jgi:hypothetical protein
VAFAVASVANSDVGDSSVDCNEVVHGLSALVAVHVASVGHSYMVVVEQLLEVSLQSKGKKRWTQSYQKSSVGASTSVTLTYYASH